MNKKFSLDFESSDWQQPLYSSSTCQIKKNLKLSSLIIFFERSFLFIDPSVSNKKFSFTILRKAFSACKHAGAHLRNPVYIGNNPDACSFRAHSTERQFTFHRTRRTKSQSRICYIREIAEHKWFEATCNLLKTIDWPLSQFLWSSANNSWVGPEQNLSLIHISEPTRPY